MPEIGDLVRVNPDYDFELPADSYVLTEHGYLWIRIEDSDALQNRRQLGLHDYRSLATGFVYRWYDYELIKEETTGATPPARGQENNHG